MKRKFIHLLVCILSVVCPALSNNLQAQQATFDEATQSLLVDCVLQVNPFPGIPAAYSFTALRKTETDPRGELVGYELNAEGMVPLASVPDDCPNKSYVENRFGTPFLFVLLPEVAMPAGSVIALDLQSWAGRDDYTLYVTAQREQRDDMSDLLVIAGGDPFILKLPEPWQGTFAFSPELHLEYIKGKHAPEIVYNYEDKTLRVKGIAPGLFNLTIQGWENYYNMLEAKFAITVCAQGTTTNDCNSDPNACNCSALDAKLATELDIREAVYLHQFTRKLAGYPSGSLRYCLAIDTTFSSDPLPDLMSRFENDMPGVLRASDCLPRNRTYVFALATGDPALVLHTGTIEWISDRSVKLTAGHYDSGAGVENNYTLEQVNNAWQVVEVGP